MLHKNKKPFPLHPFLFGIYSILFLYHYNMGQLSLNVVLVPIMLTAVGTSLLFIVLNFLLKNRLKTGILVSLFVFLFFTFGHFINFLKFTMGLNVKTNHYILYLPCYLAIFVVATYFIRRTSKPLKNLDIILNGVFSIMLIFTLVQITLTKIREKAPRGIISKTELNIQLGKINKETLPDIYYIVLDGYTGIEPLKSCFDYDNKNFYKYLEGKGFYIAYNSISNYVITAPSLASSLNMKYINYLSQAIGKGAADATPLFQMAQDNSVQHILSTLGYKTINVSSGLGPIKHNPYADFNAISVTTVNEFTMLLLKTTALNVFFTKRPLFRKKQLVPLAFSKLLKLPDEKGPKFTTSHIMSPHPPFVFGPDGKPLKNARNSLTDWSDIKGYQNEITFMNKKVKEFVDRATSNHTKPIIILQGDHGAPCAKNKKDLTSRASILNAYYMPAKCEDHFYKHISPVNTFRVIFNCLFGTNLDILKDESYHSTVLQPYKLVRITDKINLAPR